MPSVHQQSNFSQLKVHDELQCDWIKRIAAQTKANVLVGRSVFEDPDLLFVKREVGGFSRLDKIYDGRLLPVLEAFNDAHWAALP